MAKKVLLLKTVSPEMTAHKGFVYPTEGKVVAPDWDPTARCGGGIHGLLWGEGNGNLLAEEPGAKWLVLEAKEKHVVDLGGKVKVPKARVVHCGDQQSATQYLLTHGAERRAVAGATVIAGECGTAQAGDYGTATAGDYGTATAGDRGRISIERNDGERLRLVTGYIGEDNLLPDVPYKLDDKGNFIPA